MTGYHIELGYNAHPPAEENEMWEILKQKTQEICDNPQAIITEARRLRSPETCEKGCCHLNTYADNYAEKIGSYGHPISIIEERQAPFFENRQIMQLASTDDPIKYHVRRAFIRLLIEAMHKEEIEVNLTVA